MSNRFWYEGVMLVLERETLPFVGLMRDRDCNVSASWMLSPDLDRAVIIYGSPASLYKELEGGRTLRDLVNFIGENLKWRHDSRSDSTIHR